MYENPSTKSKKIGTIAKGDDFTVTGIEGNFAAIEWADGTTGYVLLENTDITLGAPIKGTTKNKTKVYSRMTISKKFYEGYFDPGETINLLERIGKWWKLGGNNDWFVQSKNVNW